MKRAVFALSPLVLAVSAWAQSAQDIEAAQRRAQQIQQEQAQQLKGQNEAAPKPPQGADLTRAVPEPAAPKLDAGPCLQVEQLVVQGDRWLSMGTLTSLREKYVGTCVGQSELQALMGAMTQDFFQQGLITTRVYLPEQGTQGTLTFKVIEGRIEAYEVDSDIKTWNIFPGKAGDVLNLRDIEQGLDQLNRLPVNRATMEILPGSAPGLSVVRIKNDKGSRVHGSVSYDNQGSESTGRDQIGVSVSVDNPTGLQDSVSLTYRQNIGLDLDHTGSQSLSANWLVPMGNATLGYAYSTSRYASTFQAPSGLDLLSTGDSNSHNLKADYVIWRGQQTKLTASSGLTVKESRNYLERQYLKVGSRRLSVLNVDLGLTTILGDWVVDTSVGVDTGQRWANALDDLPNLPDWAPRAQFEKYKLSVNLFRQFAVAGVPLNWSTSLTAQKSRDVLYGSEQISIGSLYSVRGFVKNAISGDTGYFVRNELSHRRSVSLADGIAPVMKLAAGYDFGRIFSSTPGVPYGALQGWFASLSFQLQGATLELQHTAPVSQSRSLFGAYEAPQTWVRLNWSF